MPLLHSVILAAAGGGSSGFGGGGGGGGGGFSGGGGSGGTGGGSAAGVVIIVLIAIVFLGVGAFSAWRYRRRRAARAGVVRLAAAEAATDDADFDPDAVAAAARELFAEIQRRWSENDADGLSALVGDDLMVEWRRRLGDFAAKGWRNRCEPKGHPQVEYLGLVNRDGDHEDRVVVRITAVMDDYVVDRHGREINRKESGSRQTTLTEWWTLHPPGERWRLLSIESEKEGRHHLTGDLVATPWGDGRVADDALVETATADALPAGVGVGEIAPAELDPDARAAALDLALVDGRFAPDVLEVAVRRAVGAWAEAVDGDDAALEALADRAAVDALLFGGDDAGGSTRVVVRGLRVEAVTISDLRPRERPPTMTALVALRGRRYVEDRDTAALLRGDRGSDGRTSQRWTFALSDDPAAPWRLVAVA